MNNTDIGWLAGIIDGEGCLAIRIKLKKTKNFGVRPRFQPQLTVVNTDNKIMSKAHRILEELGIKHRQFVRKRKDCLDMDCIDIYATGLRKLLPMLKSISMKRRQVDILLEALEITESNKHNTHGGHWGRMPMPVETLSKMDDLRMELVGLHGRPAKKLIKIKAEDYNIIEKVRDLL